MNEGDASTSRPPARGAPPAPGFGRVAIVHEWLTIPGGSEQVVVRLLDLFPDAELYMALFDPTSAPAEIATRPVHTSYLDRLPGARSHYRRLLPLMSRAFESFDLSSFDLVISSSHAFAKNVVTGPESLHVCYCHTPMRYAWEPDLARDEPMGRLARLALPPALWWLRRQDLRGSRRPDAFVANSSHVADRIARYYGRESEVIHPPVEIEPFLGRPRAPGDYYLTFGRVVPYKRVDIAVAACASLGRPLRVGGAGRGLPAARRRANEHVDFLGYVPDADVGALMAGARALIFPGEEDFGMVPVEAQAAGVPVIAYGRGGIRDIVVHGETGVLYDDPSVDGLCQAILDFESRSFDEQRVRDNARRFEPDRFSRRMREFLASGAGSGKGPRQL